MGQGSSGLASDNHLFSYFLKTALISLLGPTCINGFIGLMIYPQDNFHISQEKSTCIKSLIIHSKLKHLLHLIIGLPVYKTICLKELGIYIPS